MKGPILSLLAGAVVLVAAFLPGTAEAQAFCMTDSYGYQWDITLSSNQLTGTVDTGAGFDWYLTGGRGTNSSTIRSHVFTSVNPNASNDPGCDDGGVAADWFTYNGLTGVFNGTGYPYNASWINSCGAAGAVTALITIGACPAPRLAEPVENGPATMTAPSGAAALTPSEQ